MHLKKSSVALALAGLIGVSALSIHVDVDISMKDASAAGAKVPVDEWSPTKPNPSHDVYYPGTEELAADEMRVIACGTGMPMPRMKQAAACFVIELGNGDKFIFDMGNGSFERIHALGIPLDYLDKVFITHPHMDHMADLATFYMTGPQNNRSVPPAGLGSGRRRYAPRVELQDFDGPHGEDVGMDEWHASRYHRHHSL